jgi:hypothetical protein
MYFREYLTNKGDIYFRVICPNRGIDLIYNTDIYSYKSPVMKVVYDLNSIPVKKASKINNFSAWDYKIMQSDESNSYSIKINPAQASFI